MNRLRRLARTHRPITQRPTFAGFLLAIACTAVPTDLAARQMTGEGPRIPGTPVEGSVVFVHPDGSGIAAWGALRAVTVGPDGDLAWDLVPHIGIYRGHQFDAVGTSSDAGATAHAFGRKVPLVSYGTFGTEPLTALSGASVSVMKEAHRAGFATAIVNSGHIAEPGTGVFVASHPDPDDTDPITAQILASGTEFILSGGEMLLIPEGVVGRHGVEGVRRDGRNLIEEARDAGYAVVYDRDELLALPATTPKVLGVFAAEHMFTEGSEAQLQGSGVPFYAPDAPSPAEMTTAALRFLEATGRRFMLVVEEEGTDNLANDNNAGATLDALRRADETIAVVRDFVARQPGTLLIVAADSDAGGMNVIPLDSGVTFVAGRGENGAPQDGVDGPDSAAFTTAPDANGHRHAFAIGWASEDDLLGAIAARAEGLNAELLPTTVDNTDIYRMMWATLFGRWPDDRE
jgi:alkaline phosphatase